MAGFSPFLRISGEFGLGLRRGMLQNGIILHSDVIILDTLAVKSYIFNTR